MAGRIAGITIKIGADTTKLQQSLRGVDSQLKKTQSALKDVDKLLKLDPGNTELLTQKQKNLEKAIGTTKTRLDELKKAQAGVSEGTDEWDALQREIIATEQDLQGLEKEYRNFGSVGAQQVAAVGKKMQEVGSSIEGLGQKLAPVSAAAAGLIGSFVGLGYSALTSADDLNTLAKQTGLSTDEIQKMQYAADLVDVSFSDIEGALKKMKSKMDPANESFQQLGVAVTDADGNMRDATDVFYDSIAALSQIENETERDQMAMDLFGKSADSLAGIIDDGGAALKEYGQQAEDLGLILSQETLDDLNAMNDVVDTLKANFKGAFAKVGATLAKTFAPALQKAAGFAQKLADKIANLSPKTLKLVTGIAGVVAAIAPVLIVGGKLVTGVGKVLTLAPKIVSGIKLVTTALMSPVGVMGIVMAVAIALVVAVVKNWDKIKAVTLGLVENIKAAWDNLKTAVSEKWEAIKTAVADKVESIKTSVIEKWESLKESVSTAVENVKTAVIEKWEGLKTAVSTVVTNIKTDIYLKWIALKSLVSNTIENLKTSAVEKWEALKESVSEIVENVKSAVVDKWEELKASVSSAVQNLKNTLNVKWSGIKSAVFTTVTNIKDKITSKWEEAKTNSINTVSALKTEVESKWNAIKSSVSTIGQNIVNTARAKFNLVKANAVSIFGGVKTAIEEKITAAKDAVSRIWDEIKGFFIESIQLKFKLPKITMGQKDFQTFAGIISIPWPEIKWERQGYTNPVMFTKPTVMATPNGYYGFGDGHGAEIVLGLNKLRELVGSSGDQVTINVYPPAGANVEQIAAAVEQRLVAAQQRRNRVYA